MRKKPLSGRSPFWNKRLISGSLVTGIPVFLFYCCLAFTGLSQLNRGGMPCSTLFPVEKGAQADVELSSPDLSAIHSEDALNPLPYRFAVNLPVNLDPAPMSPSPRKEEAGKGIWYNLPDGSSMWLCTVKATGAKALALYFDRFHLPSGSRVFVYNRDKSRILGAYTDLNNSPLGVFATSLVPGDQVTIEYNQPGDLYEKPILHLSEIAYAYRGIYSLMSPETGFGSSGPCEVNINCTEGASMQNQKKGVVRIGVKKYSSTYWCSGSLVNNTRQDYTPFILTADHCGTGATPEDIGQWIFYFGYESEDCPNPPDEPSFRSMTGATITAAAGDVNVKGSDFFLLLLNESIPDTFNVWFNGWNRLDLPAQYGTTIHHPMGDIRKISTFTSPAISSPWNVHTELTHWEVTWAVTANGHGITEGGSSGSPLFDESGRIVGTLTGGESSCDTDALTLPDYYGKLSYSWDRNGPDSFQRLDYWLDPDNSGVNYLDGIPLSVQTPENPDELQIYPNPASGVVFLKSGYFLQSGSWQLNILDTKGICVKRTNFHSHPTGTIPWDISSLPAGFYLLKIQSAERILISRIIKL